MNLTILAAGASGLVIVLLASIGWFGSQMVRNQRQGELGRRLEGGGNVSPDAYSLLIKTNQIRNDDPIDVLLRQAGSDQTPANFKGIMAAIAIGSAVFGVLLFRHPLGLAAMAFGIAPYIVLMYQAGKRIRRISEQLPDALDLISRSLQAGHGLSESMRMAAEETHDPIGSEFARVYEENNLGRDLRECLQNLLKRTPGCFDLQIFVSSVLLQRDTGGNLVEILKNISATVRARFLFEGKLAALTSEAKFTAWVLGSLPFFVTGLISVRNPEYLSPLITDPLGNLLIVGCMFMFGFGVFLMYDFSKVEV